MPWILSHRLPAPPPAKHEGQNPFETALKRLGKGAEGQQGWGPGWEGALTPSLLPVTPCRAAAAGWGHEPSLLPAQPDSPACAATFPCSPACIGTRKSPSADDDERTNHFSSLGFPHNGPFQVNEPSAAGQTADQNVFTSQVASESTKGGHRLPTERAAIEWPPQGHPRHLQSSAFPYPIWKQESAPATALISLTFPAL